MGKEQEIQLEGEKPASTAIATDGSIIRQRIDTGPWSFRQLLILFVCFLFNIADGFDVVAMAMAAPAVANEWAIEPTALGVIFASALAGMTVGAMFLAPWSDRLGRRWMILITAAMMSLSMLATAYALSVTQLLVIRFLTGLAIGAMLASVIAMTAEYAPQRHRNFAIIFVQSGYSLGAVLVGPVSGYFVANHHWSDIFICGAIFSTVLFFVTLFWVPESIEFLAGQKGSKADRLQKINRILARLKRDRIDTLPAPPSDVTVATGSIRSLLGSAFRATTLRLWTVFFMAFWATYFFVNWIPKLIVNAGFDMQQGIAALTLFTIGSLIGALLLGAISSRFSLSRLIASMFAASVVLLAIYTQQQPQALWLLYSFMFALGFLLSGGFTGLYAVASLSYPPAIRATGFGWCVGLGRAGAILSPILAGYLVAVGWSMYVLFMVLAIPAIVISGILVYGLGAKQRSPV
ncbi:MAG: MFS transporter [Porticoccaceae bacterium]|nr:MFS transporter [Porticoccaceae bacterium]